MRRVAAVMSLALAAVAGLSWLLYRQRVVAACAAAEADARTLVRHVAASVRADLDEAERDVQLLAAYDSVAAADPAQARRDFESFARFRPHYFQVRLLDGRGMERVRLDRSGDAVVHAAVLQDKSDRYYVREILKLPEGQVYVSALDWNIEFGRIEEPRRPTLRFGVRRGDAIVVLNADARTVFRGLRESGAGFAGRIAVDDGGGRRVVDAAGGSWTFLPEAAVAGGHDDIAASAIVGALTITAARPRRDVVGQVAAGFRDHLMLAALLAVLLLAMAAVAVRSARNAALLEQARATARTIEAANVELRRTRELLVERTRLAVLGDMVPAVAHELRNPLQAMIAAVRTLERDVTSDDGRRLVAVIADELARLGRIADDLLLSGTRRQPEAVDVGLVVRQVADLLQAGRSERPLASIEVDIDPDLPSVRAVPDAVKQVLWNVLRNACEAAGPGGRVRARVTREGAFVVANVDDDGADPGGKPPGAGMGLSICNALLRRAGGSLELRPSPDGGWRARVSLPAAQPAELRT